MRIALLAVALAVTPGCAMIFAKDQKTIRVESSHAGDQVLLDGVPIGYTPARVSVDAHKEHMITVLDSAGRLSGCNYPLHTMALPVVLDLLAFVFPIGFDIGSGSLKTIKADACVVR